MKLSHVCYFNNADATFRLLMSGDVNPNPGPVSASTAASIIANDDINTGWHQWKDAFVVAVSD